MLEAEKNELSELESTSSFTELDYMISLGEVKRALKRLNHKSAPGCDGLPCNFLVAEKKELPHILEFFFNKLFSCTAYPLLWTDNFLKSIFKKGDNSDPNNYRGIAIGAALSKLYSLILLDRLEKRVDSLHPISPNQIGFKKGHRTADHIFVLNTIINKIVKQEKKKLYVAFVDFSKAYDKVNRTLLLLKLQRAGVGGLFYENIKAMYKRVNYLIKVKGGYLPSIPSSLGLKQGCVMSPLLFNIFVDDIKDIFDEECDPVMELGVPLSHILYADDLAIMSTTRQGLTKCLSRLETYCEKWQLEVNTRKSEVVIFNVSGRVINDDFYLNGKRLKCAKSYCYLGVEMTASGSFHFARDVLTEKAKKALFPVQHLISQFHIPCSKSVEFYQTFIQPIALYNAENWASLTKNKIEAIKRNKASWLSHMIDAPIETVQQKALKFILGVRKSCPKMAVLGELGVVPLLLNGFKSLLKFWHRTASLPHDTLAWKALEFMTSSTSLYSEWLETVKLLLSVLGLDTVYENPAVLSIAKFSALCSNRLRDTFSQQWAAQLADNESNEGQRSKLRFYRIFKNSFGREPYLELIPYKLRKVITKFRCSDHCLEIEIGRHKGVKTENRLCKICSLEVESEEHVLRVCPRYDHIRELYLGQALKQANWIDLLKCTDKFATYNLVNFLTKAYKIRSNLMSQESED